MPCWRISEHRQKLVVICGITCLAIAGPTMGAGSPFDGNYVGKRSLIEGTSSTQCPVEDNVSVTISGQKLTFTDSALKNFGIGFDPGSDGSFYQIFNEKGIDTVFTKGRITGETLDADVKNYVTGCTHHWHLTKEHQ